MTPERFLFDQSQNVIKTIESITQTNVSIGSIQKTSTKYIDVLLIIMGVSTQFNFFIFIEYEGIRSQGVQVKFDQN
jgi:hypothetical protein